jgi:hypothetical protein
MAAAGFQPALADAEDPAEPPKKAAAGKIARPTIYTELMAEPK